MIAVKGRKDLVADMTLVPHVAHMVAKSYLVIQCCKDLLLIDLDDGH